MDTELGEVVQPRVGGLCRQSSAEAPAVRGWRAIGSMDVHDVPEDKGWPFVGRRQPVEKPLASHSHPSPEISMRRSRRVEMVKSAPKTILFAEVRCVDKSSSLPAFLE